MTDREEVFQNLYVSLRAAVRSVKKEIRGLPQDRAEELLTAALRNHDAYLDQRSVRVLARQMSQPWWAVRHPFKARRRMRGAGDEPDEESVRLQAESEDLSRRLEGVVFGSVERLQMDGRRTVDGVTYTVRIAPWSAEVAQRIRALAHPIPVTVRPWSNED